MDWEKKVIKIIKSKLRKQNNWSKKKETGLRNIIKYIYYKYKMPLSRLAAALLFAEALGAFHSSLWGSEGKEIGRRL